MRLNYPILLPLVLLFACGPQGGTTDGSTGPAPGTDTGTGPGTGSTTATPATSGTDGTTGTTADSTAAPTTGPDPTTDGSTTAAPATTLVEQTTTTLATEAQTTGDPSGPVECAQDSDCKLLDDCCTCEGVPVGEVVAPCDVDCKQSSCMMLGVEAAACRLGVCETARLTCDPLQVACDEAPPACPKGQLPTTTPACWTGKCVPAELCDVVPDCGLCPASHVCVQKVGFGPFATTCEPIPPACQDAVDCACLGELVCTDPFGLCIDQPGDVIHCECPNC